MTSLSRFRPLAIAWSRARASMERRRDAGFLGETCGCVGELASYFAGGKSLNPEREAGEGVRDRWLPSTFRALAKQCKRLSRPRPLA